MKVKDLELLLVFSVLGRLSLIGGIAALILGLSTANLAVLALSIVIMIHSAAWEQVDKLAEAVENLKAKNQS